MRQREQGAIVAEMHEPAVPDENANYAKDFPTESMGTEEELHGAMVGMAENAPTIFALVYDESTDKVLLELTKDLQQYKNKDRPGHGFFTLEIRTTPAELTDRAAWDNRTRALQVTIWAIEDAHGKPLADDSYGGYRREVRNADHVIHRGTPNQKITGTDRHLTVGVPATALATVSHPTVPGCLHDLVTLPWYEPTFAAEPAVSAYTVREKTVYAVILSAVLRLARSFTARNEYNVDNVKVKDAWSVRPRTAPMALLRTLSSQVIVPLGQLVASHPLPGWAAQAETRSGDLTTAVTQQWWEIARAHVFTQKHMGGHKVPTVVVRGEPAMLFEHRSGIPDRFDYAFWRHDRWGYGDFS